LNHSSLVKRPNSAHACPASAWANGSPTCSANTTGPNDPVEVVRIAVAPRIGLRLFDLGLDRGQERSGDDVIEDTERPSSIFHSAA
jgi:hypothetical protein